jgi:hypothetical protein
MKRGRVERASRCVNGAFLAVAVLAGTAACVYGQDRDPKSSLQQKLNNQFILTEVARDRSGVVSAGTLLALQKDNLLMYSGTCPSSPVNTYKSGKLSQSFGHNLMRDLGGSMRMSGGATTADCPQRRFVRGTKLWVTKADVQKDGIVFRLYSTPDNEIPYYADLKFPFEKGSVPATAQALALIGEVLAIQPDPPSQAMNNAHPEQPKASVFISQDDSKDMLELRDDKSFRLIERGRRGVGQYEWSGDTLTLIIGMQRLNAHLVGDILTDNEGKLWTRKGQQNSPAEPIPPPAATPDSSPLPPIPPPPPPTDATPAQPPMETIPAPPPPAPDPVVVGIGQTPQQVEAALGKPDTILNIAAGTTRYVYSNKGIKITFKSGKVTEIQ